MPDPNLHTTKPVITIGKAQVVVRCEQGHVVGFCKVWEWERSALKRQYDKPGAVVECKETGTRVQ